MLFKQIVSAFNKSCALTQTKELSDKGYVAMHAFKHLFEHDVDRHEYGFRVTTKPLSSRQVSFRWRELKSSPQSGYDIYKIAKDNKLIGDTDNDCNKAINQSIEESLKQLSDYNIKPGIDISATNGLEKIWLFFDSPIPISVITHKKQRFSNLPDSIYNYNDYFQKYNIEQIEVVGFDFKNDSMNIYTNVPDTNNVNVLNEMSTDLNFIQCSLFDELPYDQLMGLNFTFDWEEPNIIRFCAYWIPGPKPHIPDEFHEEIPNFNQLPYYEETSTTRNWNAAVAVGKNMDKHYGKLEWIMPATTVMDNINKMI